MSRAAGPTYVDTHTHAHFSDFGDETDAVIKRALNEGVWMILVGTNLETSTNATGTAERYPHGVFAAIGLHPGDLSEERFDPKIYGKLLASDRVVGVGETGLDYFRMPKDAEVGAVKKLQQENLRAHLHFAREHELPAIIHVRNAHADVQSMLHNEIHENGPLRGLIHCFSGTAEDVARYADLGFHVSFSGTVTYGRREGDTDLVAAVRATPFDRLLIETDAPYLAPVPMRGKRNEPLFVRYTASAIAKILGRSDEEIAKETAQNAVQLFGLASRNRL